MIDTYLQNIPLGAIIPDPNQPRNLFLTLDELTSMAKSGDNRAQEILDKLNELATSILEVGLQQPISVYPQPDSDLYVIIDGHRRWLAMSLLHQQGQGDGTIQSYVQTKPNTADDLLLCQLIVNIQREDLNVFELARSIKKFKDSLRANGGTMRFVSEDSNIDTIVLPPNASEDEILKVIETKLGLGRPRLYQIEAVLKLSPKIQQMAEVGNLPESRLRYLIPLKDERIQELILKEMLEQNLSNAAIKHRIKELQAEITKITTMPKPMQIKSVLKPIRRICQEIDAVRNIPAILGAKDPRTVENYKELVPELRETIKGLQTVLEKLKYLEDHYIP